MKIRELLVRSLAFLAVGTGAGCALFSSLPGAPESASEPFESVRAIERALPNLKSDHVEVSTEVLRSLIRNGKQLQNQCNDLDSQLRALKEVDLKSDKKTL